MPNGERCCVRFCQYRADTLEKHKFLGLSENFASARCFSSLSYITTTDRLEAKRSQDLLPMKFTIRSKLTYEKDCVALQNDTDTHNVKHRSVFSQIPFINIEDIGVMPPCIMHDLFAGCLKKGTRS